ncbi:hypothetical protein [Paraoerskovia marina]|uniref:hypothetical protein n=1 Tax=Paraoerskovia marina TaxID=545619 RepID=UPI000693CEDC|nr:hypothetical protein [Paraoerskovia marina]
MTILAAVLLGAAVWVATSRPRRRAVLRSTTDRRPVADAPLTLARVCGHLRAGAPPASAWARVGVDTDAFGVPILGSIRAAVPDASTARAVRAGCLVAADTGAPLAPVLGQVGEALAAAAEADDDREAALAGPRTTARVLAWLPALGLVLGAALGAKPLGVLLGGGLGTAALVGGGVLLVVGYRWTGVLVRRARAAGAA